MVIFETIMLSCFIFSLLIRIYKTFRSKTARGISPLIFFLIFAGFVSGTIFKIDGGINYQVFLYAGCTLLVLIQIIMFFYYRNKDLNNTPPYWV